VLAFDVDALRGRTPTSKDLTSMQALKSLALGAALLACAPLAIAQEKFTYLTNWYAQAEHGGFYQALGAGLYRKEGLDVTIKMGTPT
jgi:NitT/TauT family transport system substrate-binding protein